MNTRRVLLWGLVLILVLLGAAPAARASAPDGAVDPSPEAITDPAVLAANRLMALPWAGLSRQAEGDAEEAIVRGLEDQDLANDHGGGTLNWRFRMWVKNAGADVDIASPPGFSAASLTGFTLEAPLEGGWSFKVRGTLKATARVRVGGETIFSVSPSVPFGLRVWDVKLTTRAQLDPTDQTRPGPRVVNATVNARLKLGGDGAIPISIPVSITVRVDPSDGSLTLRGPFQAFDIGDDFGILEARLGGDLIMRFTSSGDPGSEVSPLDRMTLRLTGRLSIKLKRVGRVSVPFSLTLPTVHVPAPDILQPLAGGLPRTWGQGHPRGTTPPPPTGADYATPALQLEQAIVPHIPYGGVFAIDFTPIRGPQIAERRSFGVEADSAIWTGHYLAAEAFRYAATSDPAALARLKFVLAGVQRLFDVTQDAVVRRSPAGARKRSAVQITGIFARAALQATDQVTAGPLSDRDCYYEAPEGGWDVTPRIGRRQHFAKYRDIPPSLLRGATVTPVAPVWYGFGCGHVGGPDK
ncbi:MAG TPA: hypothetical protein VGW35_08505, partial [Methylomirabilota bacterium]|nr:hypothetical protein [Methylomirabilota bacterium]